MSNTLAPPQLTPEDSHINDERTDFTVNQDALIAIAEEMDPTGVLDPDYSLQDDCANYALRMRNIFAGSPDFPTDFLPDLYRRELQYVQLGITGIRDLLRMNREAGITVRRVNILCDLDRSQVAVADSPAGELHHVPRPGWRHLLRKIDEEVNPAHLKAGVVSDRPYDFNPDQTVTTSGDGLKGYVKKIFSDGRTIEYLDTSLILSSSDGPLAESMQPILQETMRKKKRYLSPAELLQLRSNQLAEISNILDLSKVNDVSLEYHSKLGVVAKKAADAPPDEIFALLDDLQSVELINSNRAIGIYIPPQLQPYLPDERRLPEMLK